MFLLCETPSLYVRQRHFPLSQPQYGVHSLQNMIAAPSQALSPLSDKSASIRCALFAKYDCVVTYIPLFIYQYSLHILNRKPLVNDIHCEGMRGMGTTSTVWVFPYHNFRNWLTLTLHLFDSMHLQAAMAEQINLSLLCPLYSSPVPPSLNTQLVLWPIKFAQLAEETTSSVAGS